MDWGVPVGGCFVDASTKQPLFLRKNLQAITFDAAGSACSELLVDDIPSTIRLLRMQIMDSDRPSSQVGELQAGKIHAFRCPQWLNGVVQTVDTVLCEQAADCIFEVLVFLFSTAFEYDRRFSSFCPCACTS